MHRLPDFVSIPSRFLALSLALILAQAVPEFAFASSAPKATTVTEVCDGPDCTVRISFATSNSVWRAPAGSGNFRVELAGASGGGDRGGSGALVRATLNLSAGQLLEFRLGGAGKRGDGAAGGFNGGGSAGSGMGKAGSGGGMSQLFLGSVASSPILIAGGGGGAGGGAGVSGGAAGLVGESGANGKNSTGGGGGLSNRGGTAGQSGRVTLDATSGQSGLGGAGASLNLGAAGGGGGGGYFGGGGGGTSYESCCHPGSGGGGGSSFADGRYVSNPEFSAAPGGSGYAVIQYQLLPSVVSHSWQQLTAKSGELQLNFNQPVTAIHTLRVSVAGCNKFAAVPVGTAPAKVWTLRLSDCARGPQLRLASGSLESQGSSANPIFGPGVEYALQLEFSVDPAKLRLQSQGVFAASEFKMLLWSDSKISGLKSSSLTASGCELIAVKPIATGYELTLRGCRDGRHTLRLAARSVIDAQGVASPAADMNWTFRVDLVAPQASLKLLKINRDTRLAEVEYAVSEPVNNPLLALQSQLNRAGCQADWTELSATRFVGSISCGAPITLSLEANSLTDDVGRTGPASAVILPLDFQTALQDSSDQAAAVPPWIAIGASPSSAPQPSEIPDDLTSSSNGRDLQTAWLGVDSALLRNVGIGLVVAMVVGFAVTVARGVRKIKKKGRPPSAEDDSSLAVNKYPVFGKPAHRLG